MPLIAVDPGIVGSTYQAPMTLQDAQNAINWYTETAESDGPKKPVALLGCPGLQPLLSTQTGEVRGFWPLPGGQTAIAVSGTGVYRISVTVPATQTSIAQLAVQLIGTMATNAGPVCIRDNGVLTNGQGGIVFIVDGQSWYYATVSGNPITQTFTASVSSASTLITLPSTLPVGMLMSPQAVLSGAQIAANAYIASIDYNTPAMTMSAGATGTNASESITLTIAPFGPITDPGAMPSSRLAFIEGFILANVVGSRTFITTGPVAYSNTLPGSFFALKDSSTDNLITLMENEREGWLVGEKTSEVWYNSGSPTFPFARVPGVGPQIGCSAQHSITRAGPSLVWLAKNEQGENIIVATQQYSWVRISNHAVETALSAYPLVSDCIAYAYEEAGHLFAVFTFPTADATWVYDFTESQKRQKPCWHQRASWNPNTGYHRQRGNCYMDFQNLRVVGDYQTGQIHQMSRSIYTDAGNPLRCQRRSQHVWKPETRGRVFHASLQIEFTPGVGLQMGQGSTPQAMLRWSDDGGFTWSSEHWRSIGKVGLTKNRAKWNRMGNARDRVFEVNFSDPVPRDIIGATLFLEPETA